MTVICGGGTSSAQPGYGQAVYMVPSMIGALLNNIPTLWAVPLAGFIGAVTYNMSTFCSNDPPAVPTFTAQDVIDLLNPYAPGTYNDAQDKFQQLVGAYAWYQLCKCDSVSTPSAPTAPAAPSGMPSINPPAVAPAYPTGQACSSFDDARTFHSTSDSGFAQTIPVGDVTYVSVDLVESSRTTETVGTVQQYVNFLSSTGAILPTSKGVAIGAGGTYIPHQEGAVPSGTVSLRFGYDCSGGLSSPITLHTVFSLYCGTTPGGGGTVPLPCPSDPFVLAMLQQILALTTIIQRQAAPFAYALGTAHSGLSGSGHLTVNDLIGAKVVLDSTGSSVGFLSGDPSEVYQAGWITWGNADGSSKREFITHSPFVSLPALAGQYTRLGYTLGDGVSATITELVREP